MGIARSWTVVAGALFGRLVVAAVFAPLVEQRAQSQHAAAGPIAVVGVVAVVVAPYEEQLPLAAASLKVCDERSFHSLWMWCDALVEVWGLQQLLLLVLYSLSWEECLEVGVSAAAVDPSDYYSTIARPRTLRRWIPRNHHISQRAFDAGQPKSLVGL